MSKPNVTVTSTFAYENLDKFGEMLALKVLRKTAPKIITKLNVNVPVDTGALSQSGSANMKNGVVATTGMYAQPVPVLPKKKQVFFNWAMYYAKYNQRWLVNNARSEKGWIGKLLLFYWGRLMVTNIGFLKKTKEKIK